MPTFKQAYSYDTEVRTTDATFQVEYRRKPKCTNEE